MGEDVLKGEGGGREGEASERGLVAVLAAGMFVIGLDLFIVSPLLPQIAADLDLGSGRAGLLVGAFALPYGALAPVFGPVSDRWGRRRVLLAALPVFVAATAATALAPGYVTLLAARVLAGAAGAAYTPSLFAAVGDAVAPERRARAMGVVTGGATLGMIFGVPLGAWVAQATTWRGGFGFVAGLGAVVLLALARVLPASRPGEGGMGGRGAYRRAFGVPGVVPALLASGLWYGFSTGLFMFTGEVIAVRYGLDVGVAGMVFAVYGVAIGLGNAVTAAGVRRIGSERRTVSLSVVATAASVAGLMLGESLAFPVFMFLLVVWAVAGGIGFPAQQTLLAGLGGRGRGTVLSLASSAMFFGLTGASAVLGRVLDRGGASAAGLLSLAAFAAALVCELRVPAKLVTSSVETESEGNAAIQQRVA